MGRAWAGIDVGKEFHWAHVLDTSGRKLLSRRLENDEADIAKLIDEVLCLAEEVLWAVDQPGGSATLLLALLWERDQGVLYIPGLTVNRASQTYRGESKTDARDAHVIADQARMRSDLGELEPGEEEVAQLRILLGRRRDLVIDQNRTITRLGETLLSLSPALERALDLNRKGPLTLLSHYQSPQRLRRAGHKRIAAYLRNRGVKGFNSVAEKALRAAKSQSITLPAESIAARIVAELAAEVLALKDHIELVDKEIEQRFSTVRRPRSSLACRGWDLYSGPSSSLPLGSSQPSTALTISPPTQALCPRLTTLARGSETTAGCEEGTRISREISTRLPLPACVAHRSPGPSTTERDPRASGTSRHSSRSPVGG